MKVILLKDVAKIGKRFSVTDVPDGYALNQLIPKKMAEPATPANLKRLQRYQAEASASKEADLAHFEAIKKALADVKISVLVQANEQGHLFKAVHESDVVLAAKDAGVEVTSSMISVPAPIKELGQHQVELHCGDHKHQFVIEVVAK